MIKVIIAKISNGASLEDHEQEFLEHVISKPQHEDYVHLWIAGLV